MYTMENILHTYLTRLRLISKIPVNGRLDTTKNDLNIYYGGLFGWMYRKVCGDNKESATKYLINLYREINSFSDQLMYNIDTEQSETRKRKKMTMLVSLTEKLKESLTGIRNLIGTYKDYLKIVSLLECLEHDLVIPQYRTLLKFIPSILHTEILKASITYSHINQLGFFGCERSLSDSGVSNLPSEPMNIKLNNTNKETTALNISRSVPTDFSVNKNNKNKNNI